MAMKKVIKEIYAKVWKVTKTGQKLVTIPKTSEIEAGDYVKVEKTSK